MKLRLKLFLFFSVCLPLSANAASYVCSKNGAGASGYPTQLSLTVAEDGASVNGHRLKIVNFKGQRMLKLNGSPVLYTVYGEYRGQRPVFMFDPSNAAYRSKAGNIHAVAKYICN